MIPTVGTYSDKNSEHLPSKNCYGTKVVKKKKKQPPPKLLGKTTFVMTRMVNTLASKDWTGYL